MKQQGLVAGHVSLQGLEESVSLNWVLPEDPRAETKARRHELHARVVGFTVLNRRLSKLARQGDAPFLDAHAAREIVQGGGIVTSLTVRTRPGAWERGLKAAEQELRRALKHGFQQGEVDREALEQKSPYLLQAANGRAIMDGDFKDRDAQLIGGKLIPLKDRLSLVPARARAERADEELP